jgi:nitroreductase
MEFQQVAARRRMVRHFAPDPIERAVLERIAKTAQRAPRARVSALRTQP